MRLRIKLNLLIIQKTGGDNMKVKTSFHGVVKEIPQRLEKSFQLNDRYHSAKLSLDRLGNYDVHVPYNVTDATARRSLWYKSTMLELTQQMLNAYTNATAAFVNIVKHSVSIETEIQHYLNRLEHLQPAKYTRNQCSALQPTKQSVKVELEEEAAKKYYTLFFSNSSIKKRYVEENLETTYADRLKKWEEVVSYFDYIESIVEAKANKEFYERYLKEKKILEDKLFGPDEYVQTGISEIKEDPNLPVRNLPCVIEYKQKDKVLDITVDIDSEPAIPGDFAQLYATGKLWIKAKHARDLAFEKTSYYLGLAYYLSSKLFGLTLNISKIHFSLVNNRENQGILWVEFERDSLKNALANKSINLIQETLMMNHVFDLGNGWDLKKIPLQNFNQLIEERKNRTQLAKQPKQPSKRTDYVEVSIQDAKLLANSIHDNQELLAAIRDAENNNTEKVNISKAQAGILEEIKKSDNSNTFFESPCTPPVAAETKEFSEAEYHEYNVTEQISENDSNYNLLMRDFIQKVIKVEAPISRDLLNRRICAAMGISRVSARLSERLSSLISTLNLFTTESGKTIYWSDQVHPENFRIYRTSSGRDVLDIPYEEIANCIVCYINSTGEYDKEIILRSSANILGFTRMGVNVKAAMEAGLQYGLKTGILNDNGAKISITI
jgi:hypothetical protein